MTCDMCGMPAQGRLCRECELVEHLEDHHGVPSDHFDEDLEEADQT